MKAYIATFSRNVSSAQNNYFRGEGVNFIFKAIEDVYIVLITTLSSNIIEDTGVLDSIASSLSQFVTINSEELTNQIFDVLFIIDEFVEVGHVSALTADEIDTRLKMESAEEQAFIAELELKKAEAEKIAKQKMKEIEEEKKLREKLQKENQKVEFKRDELMAPVSDIQDEPAEKPKVQKKKRSEKVVEKKGIQLGKKKATNYVESDSEDEVEDEDEVNNEREEDVKLDDGEEEKKEKEKKVVKKEEKKLLMGVALIKLAEDSRIEVHTEEGSADIQVSGSLAVVVSKESNPIFKLNKLSFPVNNQLHPQVDGKVFNEDRILQLKAGKKFATGGPAIYAKWNYKSNDMNSLPIVFTIWPSENDGSLTISWSYECKMDMKSVKLYIPNKKAVKYTVNQIDGELNEDESDYLVWVIGDVTNSQSGSLEIDLEGEIATEDIYPLSVKFDMNNGTVSGNDVIDAIDNGSSAQYESDVNVTSSYLIYQ